MAKSERLLELLQLLRCHRFPVTAEALASELGVSIRTIYRDIATLQAQGADIEGEAGIGYQLRPGFTLPPLMFSAQELEALALGANWIARQADGEFKAAALNAIAKISAVLPPERQLAASNNIVQLASWEAAPDAGEHLAAIKQAITEQRIAEISYLDGKGKSSTRRVWPLLVGIFERSYMLVAWCEAREDFRHFRLDRIEHWHNTEQRYKTARQVLLKQWREKEGIEHQNIGY